jgi:hypothetical protein
MKNLIKDVLDQKEAGLFDRLGFTFINGITKLNIPEYYYFDPQVTGHCSDDKAIKEKWESENHYVVGLVDLPTKRAKNLFRTRKFHYVAFGDNQKIYTPKYDFGVIVKDGQKLSGFSANYKFLVYQKGQYCKEGEEMWMCTQLLTPISIGGAGYVGGLYDTNKLDNLVKGTLDIALFNKYANVGVVIAVAEEFVDLNGEVILGEKPENIINHAPSERVPELTGQNFVWFRQGTADPIYVSSGENPKPEYTLQVLEPEGNGTVNPPVGSHGYVSGAEAVLTASPSAGNKFVKWVIEDKNGKIVTIDGMNIKTTMNVDKTAKAYFEAITSNDNYTLQMQSPEGSGTVEPTVGSHAYTQNTTVTLTATPSSGYKFKHWTVNGTLFSTNKETNLQMNADKSVKATFVTGDPDNPDNPVNPTPLGDFWEDHKWWIIGGGAGIAGIIVLIILLKKRK